MIGGIHRVVLNLDPDRIRHVVQRLALQVFCNLLHQLTQASNSSVDLVLRDGEFLLHADVHLAVVLTELSRDTLNLHATWYNANRQFP